jgi:hypothetical protein
MGFRLSGNKSGTDALAQLGGPYELAPLDGRVAADVGLIDWDVVPDPPNRVIAATALSAGVALVSRNGKIRASQVRTIPGRGGTRRGTSEGAPQADGKVAH